MALYRTPRAPNLQVPSQQYNAAQQQQLVNQLKLYFAQTDPTVASLIQQSLSQSVGQWISTGNG